ncbi:MAG: carboxypeptidase regulatory-like domain-containing protein [Planctomycetota bacterium]|nr:MAG: carboxypeptidase regulatory-like domain-containing protein [Planctomycetota bacterium]
MLAGPAGNGEIAVSSSPSTGSGRFRRLARTLRRPFLALVAALGLVVVAVLAPWERPRSSPEPQPGPSAAAEEAGPPPVEQDRGRTVGEWRETLAGGRMPAAAGSGFRIRLVAPDGTVLAGAEILARRLDEPSDLRRFLAALAEDPPPPDLLRTTPAPDGRAFLAADPRPGEEWAFAARAPTRACAFRRLVLPNPLPTPFDLGQFVLAEGARLRLEVRTAAGEPAAEARVAVIAPGLAAVRGVPPARFARTGPDGRVTLAGLPPGPCELTVERAGSALGRWTDLRLAAGEEAFRVVVLPAAGAIRGLVIEPGGAPAAGVRISARPQAAADPAPSLVFAAGREFGPPPPTATTDERGLFALEGLDRGREWEVTAEAPAGPASALVGRLVRRHGVRCGEVLLLRLPPARTASGVLLTAAGTPAAGARIAAVAAGSDRAAPGAEALSNADGCFRLSLPPAADRLAVWHPAGETVFPLAEPPPPDLGALRLARGGDLVVRARGPAGEALTAFAVRELPPERDERPLLERLLAGESTQAESAADRLLRVGRPPAEAGPDGVARLAGLPAGARRFEVRAEGLAPLVFAAGIRPGEVTTFVAVLPAAAELEVLLRSPTGEPVSSQELFLRPDDNRRRFQDTATATTGPDGRARFRSLEPGPVRVSDRPAVLGGSPLGRIEVVPGPNRLELRLPEEWPFTVRVLDAAGPAAGVEVRAEDPRQGLGFLADLIHGPPPITGPDGRVSLGPLRAGRLRLTARRPGSAPLQAEVELTAPDQEFELRFAGVEVSGRVEGASGRCRVRLAPQAGLAELSALLGGSEEETALALTDRIGRGRGVVSACDADGRFRFADVPPGSYTLDVETSGAFLPEPMPLEVADRALAGLLLSLTPEAVLVLRVDGLEPGRWLELTARPKDGGERSLRIEADGRWRLGGLPPGPCAVEVQPSAGGDRRLWQVDLVAGQATELRWRRPPAPQDSTSGR